MNNFQLKLRAKQIIASTKPSPILIAIMYVGIAYILSSLSVNLTGVTVNMNDYYNAMTTGDVYYFQNLMQSWHPGVIPTVVSLTLQLLKIIMLGGFIIFSLNTVRCANPRFENILDGFAIWYKLILLAVVSSILIALWSLLLVIPGIIAFYRYRLALYILIDNPNKSIMSCLKESSHLMKGNKGRLFTLDLSFLGWIILTAIPFISIWVTPYMQTTYALFYDSICPQIIIDNNINSNNL